MSHSFEMAERQIPWTLSGDGAPDATGVRALTDQDIAVHFQPIVRTSTRKIFAYEALVRCKVPAYQSPTALFDAALLENAIPRLGRQIRDATFPHCQGLDVFINIHPAELESRWIVRPDDPMNQHDGQVYLEITEAAAFEQFDLCMSVLKNVCSRASAHLVVDDLGTGHSNLTRVLDLEPRIVKLDMSLIRNMDKLPRKRVLVKHLTRLCTELEAEVVAEGIETAEELRAACDVGVQLVQGYALARPAFPPPPIHWPWV
jgi:EAL domain-containing protein (putative c-di-GMP-specific phosphodiesterase class I)